MKILAIIPARGGSKGLPDKNILPLMGHPLIAYSVKTALDSKWITRTIVSTDSDKIAKTAKAYGAEVPFIRPTELAQDFSTDLEVFQHALMWLAKNENYYPDLVVQLRPTSPIRKVQIVDECIEKLSNSSADSLRIITHSPITPYKMWIVGDENDPMTPLLNIQGIKEPYNQPRQILPQTYWQIGFLDVIKPNVIIEKNSMSGEVILPYVVENEFAVDIDNMDSFEKAEKIINTSNDFVKFETT